VSVKQAETTAAPAEPRHARNTETDLGHAEPRGGQSRDSNRCHAEPRSTRREEKATSTPSSALSAPPRANLSGWQTVKLGEVCEITMGQSPDGDSYNTTGDGIPLINGPVEFSDDAFGETVRSKFTTQPTRFCKAGDLILCVRGSTTGRTNIAGFDACIGRGVAAIRAKQYQPWINHFVVWKRDEIHGKGTGATFPNVSGDTIATFPILMPPLPEQRRIVGILDEALAGIAAAKAHAERNRQNARALFESHLHAVFSHPGPGWTEKPFEDLIESNLIGLTRSSREQGDDRRYPYVKMNHITRENRFDFSEYVNVDATPEEAERFALRAGDFLFNTRNSHELVGKSCIYDGPADGTVLFNNNIMRVRFRSGVEARFVLLAFSSREVTAELEAMKSGTTNVAAIYYKDLRSLKIPLPPVREQQRIANELGALAAETRRLEGLYERKAAALDELKQSLLHQAFSGQL